MDFMKGVGTVCRGIRQFRINAGERICMHLGFDNGTIVMEDVADWTTTSTLPEPFINGIEKTHDEDYFTYNLGQQENKIRFRPAESCGLSGCAGDVTNIVLNCIGGTVSRGTWSTWSDWSSCTNSQYRSYRFRKCLSLRSRHYMSYAKEIGF